MGNVLLGYVFEDFNRGSTEVPLNCVSNSCNNMTAVR